MQLHSVGVKPQNGTAACWAKSRRPQLASKTALLTAKHILGQSVLGHSVPLTSGSGRLIDLAPEGRRRSLVGGELGRSQLDAPFAVSETCRSVDRRRHAYPAFHNSDKGRGSKLQPREPSLQPSTTGVSG